MFLFILFMLFTVRYRLSFVFVPRPSPAPMRGGHPTVFAP